MKKFQTHDRYTENGYERSHQKQDTSNENGYEKSQQRHDRCNRYDNGYEKFQQRHNRCNENGYERPKQRCNRYNENGYERPQLKRDKYNEDRYERFEQRHDKCNETGYEREQQRQKLKTEEGKHFSMSDSSRYKKDNFYDENVTTENHKPSQQVERRSRYFSPAYLKAIKDLEKNPRLDEHKQLKETNNITEQSANKENYEETHEAVHTLCFSKTMYPHSKNLNVKEVSSIINGIGGFLNERRDDYISEEGPSNNLDVKNLQFGNENSLPFLQRNNTSYETNQNERDSYVGEENYEETRENVHKLCFNKRIVHPCSKNLNLKEEISSITSAMGEILNGRRDGYISQEIPSKILDVKNLQYNNRNSLPFLQKSTTSYESNQNEKKGSYVSEESCSLNPVVSNLQFSNENVLPFFQESNTFYKSNQNEKRDRYIREDSSLNNPDAKNLQFSSENPLTFLQRSNMSSYESNQSNPNIHDMFQSSIYTQEEKENFQNKNKSPNSSLRAISQNNSTLYEHMGFKLLKLIDLIHYNANLMQGQKLFEYASAVKSKILEKIDKFQYPERNELEFLCEITDGDQSEKNQRIITSRTCCIVRNIIDKFPFFINALEPLPPPPQIIVYQTISNSHALTNNSCNNYESPAFELVQNSEILKPVTNLNLVPVCNIPPAARFVAANEISDSSDIQNSNNHTDNCKEHKLSTNNTKNNTNIPLIAKENKCVDEPSEYHIAKENKCVDESSEYHIAKENKCVDESSDYHTSPVNSGESTMINNFSFNEKDSFFFAFNFNDLLECDVDRLYGEMVFDYAFSMKRHILKKINRNQFRSPYKEKLHFLCQITDGTQHEQNQKFINRRMCDLIISDYEDRLNECNPNFLDEQSENDDQRSC